MENRGYELCLTPINPFTPQQARIVELLAKHMSSEDICNELNIGKQTLQNYFSGAKGSTSERIQLGIYGVVEHLTGVRPMNRVELVNALTDDVLFWRQKQI